jgi:hypothetical protein
VQRLFKANDPPALAGVTAQLRFEGASGLRPIDAALRPLKKAASTGQLPGGCSLA